MFWQLVRRLRYWTRQRQMDDELADELAFHHEMKRAELERLGIPRHQADLASRRVLGNGSLVREDSRAVWIPRWLEDAARDLAFAIRGASRRPGFTVAAALTIAVGIGANTAVFTVVDALWFRPPPFDGAERLHWIVDVNDTLGVTANSNMQPSPGNFVDWRNQTRSFDHMSAWQNWFFSIASPGRRDPAAEQVRGVRVSPAFFSMLGVEAALGRTFQPNEEEPGHDDVVILTDGLWRRRFGADPRAVGETVLVDGQPHTVVGVLPADFGFMEPDFQMWLPLPLDGTARNLRASHSVAVLARLAPGVSLTEAQADLDRIAADLAGAYPATNSGWGARLRPIFPFNTNLRPTLLVLLVAVGCVLLIACVNVANLLLVRIGQRRPELAIRTAVGASRVRLIRQIVAESVLLAGIGAIAGVGLAAMGLNVLTPLLPPVRVSGPLTLSLDVRVLLFTAAVTCLTAMAFGVWPALYGTRTTPLRVMSAGRARLGRALTIAEIALSLMLLIVATLLIRSLWNLQRVDPGFTPGGLVTMQVWLPETRYPGVQQVSSFHQEILRRLDRYPELRAVALANTRPFLGWSLGARLQIPGRPPSADGEYPIVGCRVITPDYFAALGTSLVHGRLFTESDGPTGLGVAIVNESLANQYWPTVNPIGAVIRATSLGSPLQAPWWPYQLTDTFTIVGVVRDVREGRVRDQPESTVYLSYLQNPSRYMHMLVRSQPTLTSTAMLVQRELRGLDADLGVYDIRSMEAVLAEALGEPRFNSILLWVFAGAALVLSAIGVYGVTSYAIMQRTREFALRVALGAAPRSIVRLAGRDCLIVALTGTTIGLAGALLLAPLLIALLYGIVPTDMTTLVGSVSIILTVAILACWRPVSWAATVDPMTVLRGE
jgi:putative ABC transport system permease protein